MPGYEVYPPRLAEQSAITNTKKYGHSFLLHFPVIGIAGCPRAITQGCSRRSGAIEGIWGCPSSVIGCGAAFVMP